MSGTHYAYVGHITSLKGVMLHNADIRWDCNQNNQVKLKRDAIVEGGILCEPFLNCRRNWRRT